MISEAAFHKELDLIQGIVQRMGNNSFLIKGWMLTLNAVILAIDDSNSIHLGAKLYLILLVPIFVFWYLDSYFLSVENQYRELYKWSIKHRPSSDLYLYDLNTFVRTVDGQTEDLNKPDNQVICVMFSKTIVPLYLIQILFLTGLIFYNIFK